MQLPQSGWRKALTHVQMVLVGVIQDLMAQPPNVRSKEKKNRYEQEEVEVCDGVCPWEGALPILLPSQGGRQKFPEYDSQVPLSSSPEQSSRSGTS